QVAYAARIAVSSAEVGRRERARWKVVLLDEYQDTSVGQLRMLEALFGGDTGHPVLAVGDPRQSIYGWRGASAGTIERFPRTFPGRPDLTAAPTAGSGSVSVGLYDTVAEETEALADRLAACWHRTDPAGADGDAR